MHLYNHKIQGKICIGLESFLENNFLEMFLQLFQWKMWYRQRRKTEGASQNQNEVPTVVHAIILHHSETGQPIQFTFPSLSDPFIVSLSLVLFR